MTTRRVRMTVGRKTFWRRIWITGIAIVGVPILAIGIWTIFYFKFLAATGAWKYPVLSEGSLWEKCIEHFSKVISEKRIGKRLF